MRKVRREEILDNATYETYRPAFRQRVIQAKRLRRVHLGEEMTFLFENADTIRYQVQEMMRTEGIVSEPDILHELRTYNELLGDPGELGATLLIEIEDAADRDEKLKAWLALPQHLYARFEDGSRERPVVDERQVGTDRLSSVQYLRFPCRHRVPVALGSDLPGLELEVELTSEQRQALAEDLGPAVEAQG